jgi:membrane protein
VWSVLNETWRSFQRHDGPLLSGAVAFYSILATAPLGVFAVVIGGLVLGEDAARGELRVQLEGSVGPQGAEFISDMVLRASEPSATQLASVLGFLFFVVASTRLFSIVQAALNHVWGVRISASLGGKGRALKLLRKRLISFAMVFVFGGTVLGAVMLKVALLATLEVVGGLPPRVWSVIEFFATEAVLTFMVAMLFRLLPDVRISWPDIWRGSVVTAFLSSVGALLVSTYLGWASAGSMYGAAGSLVISLLWVYYTAQIFFLGAEFTGVWARRRGDGVRPLPHAVFVVEQSRLSIVPDSRSIEADS